MNDHEFIYHWLLLLPGKGLDWDPQDPIVQQWQRKLNEITGKLINGVMHACGVVFNPITVYDVISA